jgi:hypothetical protein
MPPREAAATPAIRMRSRAGEPDRNLAFGRHPRFEPDHIQQAERRERAGACEKKASRSCPSLATEPNAQPPFTAAPAPNSTAPRQSHPGGAQGVAKATPEAQATRSAQRLHSKKPRKLSARRCSTSSSAARTAQMVPNWIAHPSIKAAPPTHTASQASGMSPNGVIRQPECASR